MATMITIRHVPEEVRNELAGRAARSGRSLQEYMLREVKNLAARTSNEDLIAEIEARKRAAGRRIPTATIIADIHADWK